MTTKWIMTYPVYTDFYKGYIRKATKTFNTEAEAEAAMVKYAKENKIIVKEAPAKMWQIKKVTK